MKLPKIFLASESPRRRELLMRIGIEFELVNRIPFDESIVPQTSPDKYAEALARMKAENAIAPQGAEGIVLAFDTIVFIDNAILGKPANKAQAKEFLKRLSGRWHTVFTGVAARKIPEEKLVSSVEATKVLFSNLSDDEIDAYIASGEPFDKAGAYGIQELGALLVEKVDGCFYNVVGLPLLCLTDVLAELNINRLIFLTPKAKT